MIILQQPDALSLSGNIKDFIISSSEIVRFRLFKGESVLLDNQYSPDAEGKINIAIKDVVHSNLSFTMSSSDSYLQENLVGDFTAMVGETSVVFRAVKCGVANLHTSAAAFLTGNFLTWQPQAMEVRYAQPQWLTYYNATSASVDITLKSYLNDGSSKTTVLYNVAPGSCVTTNVQFAHIWGITSGDRAGYYDVYVSDAGGNIISYIQRYILSENLPEDKFFLFENTLGGLDCAVFTGENVIAPSALYKNAKYNEVLESIDNDINRTYSQNTGYKNTREILWLKDFWGSSSRFIVEDGHVRKIVINDSNISASNMEQLNSFTFTYKYSEDSGLQNLARVDTLSAPLEIVTPDSLFFLAPRLSEFLEAELQDFLLIPVQSPYVESWYKITLGALKNYIEVTAVNTVAPSTHAHNNKVALDQLLQEHINVLRLLEIDTSGNIKIKSRSDGLTRDLVTDGLFRSTGFKTLEAVLGLLYGHGTIIEGGKIQTDNLEVRQSMTILDLIINQLQGIAADFLFTDVGKVTGVEQLDSSTYVLTIDKKTDSDFTTLGVDDILHMIVNSIPAGGQEYYSSWMRVVTVNLASNAVTVVLYGDGAVPGGKNHPPVAGYNVARKGNVVLPDIGNSNDRSQLWMLSSREGRIQFLQNVFKPILEDYNYALTLGKLPDIAAIKKLPVTTDDIGLVAQTAIVEKLYQFDYNGDIVANKVDRGQWSADIAASEHPYRLIQHKSADPTGNTYTLLEQHTVWHLGCKWGCLTDSTIAAPAWNSPHWVLLEGSSDLEMRFTSSNGNAFHAGHVDTIITPSVYMGNIDISADIAVIDWSWVFERGTVANRILHLTNDIMPANWSRKNKAKFSCTAYVRVGENDVQPVSNDVII